MSAALARNAAVATRLLVRPKSVINCDRVRPPAARSYTIGLFRFPAAMRVPSFGSTAVSYRKRSDSRQLALPE